MAAHRINLQSRSFVWMGEQNVKDLHHHLKPPSSSELHLGTTSLDLGSAFKTMSMNKAKDIDGFPITFTGQASESPFERTQPQSTLCIPS